MKHSPFRYIACLLALLIFSACTGNNEKPYRVWVLHSYQADCPWMDDLNRGIVDGFKKEHVNVELIFSYLHSDYSAARCRDSVKAVLNRMEKPDLILSVNDQATQALQAIEHPTLHYKNNGLTVVFCGVDYPDSIRPQAYFRGFSTPIDFNRSIKLAIHLDLAKMRAFVKQNNLCDIAVEEIKKQRKTIDTWFPVEFNDVDSLHYHDVFYTLISEQPKSFNVLCEWDCYLSEFVQNSNTPFITFSNEGFGSGYLGGYFTPSYNQAFDGALYAARYLKYKQFPEQVMMESEKYFMLDWKVLERFNLVSRKLPISDIHYINVPFDVKYKTELTVALIISVILFTLFIAFLVYKLNLYNFRKKEAEKTLKQQRDNLQVITDSISEGIISVTSAGLISTINAEARALLRLPLPESAYINTPLGELIEIVDASTSQCLRPLFEAVVQKKETVRISPDSSIKCLITDRYFLAEGEFAPLEKDNVSDGAVFVFTDRTDEFTTMEYLSLTSAAGQLFFWWYDFGKEHFIVDPSFFALFDLPDDGEHTLPLSVVLESIHPEDRARWYDIYAHQRFNQDLKMVQEARININEQGEQWWEIRMVYQPNYDNNSLPMMYGLAINIQNYKEKQALLEDARENVHRSERLKSAFLSNMSHEIRTPLNGIIGFAKLIASDEEFDPEEHRLFVDTIQSNCNLMLALINDILDLARIDSGNMVYMDKPCDLNELITQIITTQQVIIQKRLELIKQLPADPEILFVDKLRLNQVITNLINNAIKFTKEGSITVGYTADENEIRIMVADTGIGIPEGEQDQIFERFYKKHDDIQGAGIGLNLCKNIIEHYKGRIVVASKLGEGTTFTVILPKN